MVGLIIVGVVLMTIGLLSVLVSSCDYEGIEGIAVGALTAIIGYACLGAGLIGLYC